MFLVFDKRQVAFVLNCSVTEDEAKDVHKSLKIAAGIFKTLKVKRAYFVENLSKNPFECMHYTDFTT